MNIFSLRENKLGMTLVEMVISLVVLSILMTSTMGMVISSNSIFISTSKAAIDKQVGNYTFDFIESVLRYTTHMSIYDGSEASKGTNIQSLSIQEVTDDNTDATTGTLMYKRADGSDPFQLYDNSFYGGRTIQYSVHKVGRNNKHIKLKVTVYRDGRAVYSREAIVKCLNLNLVAIGDGANPIVDKSSADAVNQFITFSVDEQLLSGGKNAFSLEYKVAEYMAKYNEIQDDYVEDIRAAYAKYINNDYDAATDPGIMNTGSAYNKRLTASLFSERANAVNRIVFGENNLPTNREGDISTWVNLRDYYQGKINDLLKFDLKTSNGANFVAGAPTTARITGTESSSTLTYNSHTGDEFYGVVATKEELWLGFMLTYYDKNGDHKISKEEYPQFEGDSFFQGTSIQDYVKNTTDNQMLVMTYYNDNVDDENYKAKLIGGTTKTAYLSDGTQSHTQADDGNESSPTLVKKSQTHYKCGDAGSENNNTSSTTVVPASASELDQNRFYYFYSDQEYTYGSNGKITVVEDGYHGVFTNYYNYPGTNLTTYLNNTLKATDLTPNINVTQSVATPDSHYNNRNPATYTTNKDLVEGWYYTRVPYWNVNIRNNTRYCYSLFYLKANDTVETYGDEEIHTNPRKIVVRSGQNITIRFEEVNKIGTDLYYQVQQIQYYAAKFKINHVAGGSDTFAVRIKSFTAHNYGDYILYGADWNSWFNSTPQGILNGVITGISKFITSIFGGTIKKDVSYIDATNAYQSLGNHGQTTVDNWNDSVGSYNLAWTVYSPKRGTWYYIPAQSTRISNFTSGLGFTSSKDKPVALDCDLEDGTWKDGGSSAMVSDIEQRKLSGDMFFGTVATRDDVLWVALPTGNTINPSDLVDD